MRGAFIGLLLATSACSHLTPFSPRALVGQTFPLRPGWSMAASLDGSVAGRPAILRLAVEEPFSRVTEGCFEGTPEVLARVDTGPGLGDGGPASGRHFEQQVLAADVRLGSRSLGDVRALLDAGAACELTLGSEILIGFVLEMNPAARTVTFHAQMPAPPVFQSEESVLLELSLDPRTDRPSLAVQLDAAANALTLPMVLTTAQATVSLSVEAGRALTGSDASVRGLALKSLALAPGWVLHHAVVSVAAPPGAEAAAGSQANEPLAAPGPAGFLGADAWGHYRLLLDLRGQRLVLYRRPPPVDGAGPESWTHLASNSTPTGSLVRLIFWQTLEAGGEVPLEPEYVSLTHCRVGLTLAPEDSGASLAVAIPWPGLEEALPVCARELATVPAWAGELQAAPTARPCSGTCIYAQELPGGRAVCSCSSRPEAGVQRPPPEQGPASGSPGSSGSEPEDPPGPKARKASPH
jgi:hypothetical protein